MDVVIYAIMVVVSFLVAYRQHKEKGFIFTNRWLWTPKKERENMDERIKKAEYRFARNVSFVFGILFSIFLIASLTELAWVYSLRNVLFVFALLYAIVQLVINIRFFNSIEDEKVGRHRK